MTMPTFHEVCLAFRGHPNTLFYIATVGNLILAVTGWLVALAVLLAVELAAGLHVINHTYHASVYQADHKRYSDPDRSHDDRPE